MEINSIGDTAYSAMMSQEISSIMILRKAMEIEKMQGEAMVELLNKVPIPGGNSVKIDEYV